MLHDRRPVHSPLGALSRRGVWLRAMLLSGLALPGTLASAAEPPPQTESDAEGDLPELPAPPAWIQWLGWSDDGRRMAWREGNASQSMAPGLPAEIARLDETGAVVERAHIKANIAAALEKRTIRAREVAETQIVSPSDVLVRTARNRLFAVAVRGSPPTAAVLERRGKVYEPVARWAVRGPTELVKVTAMEDDGHRLLALIVHTGEGKSHQGTLLVLPLKPGVGFNASPAGLPADITPVTTPAREATKRASP